jgi:large subunit ribosomal protein L22
MPKYGYSAKFEEPVARALGKEMRVSPKHAMEVCRAIRGMKLAVAKNYLQDVIKKKRAVPYRRHKKKIAHRGGMMSGDAGQYPVKAASAILKVLENAEANAKYKGMDEEKLRIVHASAQKGITIPGFIPRAFARATAFNKPTSNIEIILKEVS